jgi:hypothetical protein
MKNFLIFIGFLCVFSCCSPYGKEIEEALKQAGDNRKELERVLEYYNRNPADSLKFCAAEFLIANMPGHWSFDNDMLNIYYSRADSILTAPVSPEEKAKQLYRISSDYPDWPMRKVEDIRVITSDYLIRNIDQAFDVWKHATWARHLTFDDFCEYLLPYRVIDGQPLDNRGLKPLCYHFFQFSSQLR